MQVIFSLILSLFFSSIAFQVSAEDILKPRLVFFNEGHCETEQKMIQAEEFVQKIQGIVNFEALDFSKLSIEERKCMKEKYRLQDLPRLVLFDASGEEITRFGFMGEKPEGLATQLVNIMKQVKDLESAALRVSSGELTLPSVVLEDLYKNALYLKRETIATKFLDIGVEQNNLFFLLEKYRHLCENGQESHIIREKIMALDPHNEKEAFYSLALIDFQTLSSKSSHSNSSHAAIRPLEDYLTQFGERDTKNRWRLEMMVAQFYLNNDEWAKSLKHAEIALNEAPPLVKKEINKCCDYIKGQLHQPQIPKELAECTR